MFLYHEVFAKKGSVRSLGLCRLGDPTPRDALLSCDGLDLRVTTTIFDTPLYPSPEAESVLAAFPDHATHREAAARPLAREYHLRRIQAPDWEHSLTPASSVANAKRSKL